MFKNNWEKTSALHPLPKSTVEHMARLAYPGKKLISCELLAGGCANLNYKILVSDEQKPLILRVYLRDSEAPSREQKLAALLKSTVPIPQSAFIGKLDNHHFSIAAFMPGMLLRDLLLSDIPYDLNALMFEVGTVLAHISKHTFAQAGFFDKNLNVTPHSSSEALFIFANECLASESVLSVLSGDTLSKIKQTLNQYQSLLLDDNQTHLVHGDFDPANLLVDNIDNTWKITGILDWEFAFSGSSLWDIANMLRYAHQMPVEFQNAFLEGLKNEGLLLPENWRITVHLFNISSLLDCLKRSDPKISPNQCADIVALIDHILSELDL